MFPVPLDLSLFLFNLLLQVSISLFAKPDLLHEGPDLLWVFAFDVHVNQLISFIMLQFVKHFDLLCKLALLELSVRDLPLQSLHLVRI